MCIYGVYMAPGSSTYTGSQSPSLVYVQERYTRADITPRGYIHTLRPRRFHPQPSRFSPCSLAAPDRFFVYYRIRALERSTLILRFRPDVYEGSIVEIVAKRFPRTELARFQNRHERNPDATRVNIRFDNCEREESLNSRFGERSVASFIEPKLANSV